MQHLLNLIYFPGCLHRKNNKPLFHFFKVNIISGLGFRFRFSRRRAGSVALFLLVHLLLHPGLHFLKALFYFSGGQVHRYHQFKYELVGDIGQYGV